VKHTHFAAGLLAIMFLFAASQCVIGSGGAAPVALTQSESRLEALLQRIAYTSPNVEADSKAAMYQVSFRTCPPCIQSHENILPKLEAAGIETRLVTTARRGRSTADERAAVSENARRRDWSFTQRWWADRSPNRFYGRENLPPVEGDAQRETDLAQLQDDVDELVQILAINGVDFAFPALLWRSQDGTYKAAIGYNPGLSAHIISDVKGS